MKRTSTSRSRGPIIAHALLASCTVGAIALATQQGRIGDDSAQRAGAQPEISEFHPLADVKMDMESGMQKWMELSAPSKQHEWYKPFVGEWKTSSKFWMEPGADPMVSSGSATYEMVMDGRFLKQEYKGEFMGMPMEGVGYSGFDNITNLFNGVWMDSMGTGIYPMKGSLSMDGKTMTLFGNMDDPMTGEMGKVFRYTITWKNQDTFLFSGHEVMYGDPTQVMEITYTRK